MHRVEAVTISDVVGHDDPVSAFVVARSDRLEAFLAGSVPQLQLDTLRANCNHFNLEIDADCGQMLLRELIVRESSQQAGLTHAAVTNQDELYHFVELGARGRIRLQRLVVGSRLFCLLHI